MKNFFRKTLAVLGAALGGTALATTNAMASPTVADIWAAVDYSGISDNMIPIFVGIIGLVLVVSAFRIGKKLSSRIGSVG